MKKHKIDLTQLRKLAESANALYWQPAHLRDDLLALIDTAEAALRLADDLEWPELGASGPPDYLARTLTRFTTTEPT